MRPTKTLQNAFSLVHASPTRIEVRLAADLGDAEARELQAALLEEIRARGTQPTQVVLDLTRLRRCSAQARQSLYEIQRELAAHGVRTTYVAQAPRRSVRPGSADGVRAESAIPQAVELRESGGTHDGRKR